ncbi:GCN5 family acetyltransferase [Scytonema hofmannii PCC 7110]|uniref:GCN5 family acetyltransferase n=1 Tax=Scytonema hofmannii PCC 7110 TaxID=128403 RepID=A0A139WTU8_9CYAN|nr:GNAT family N-acetyltransferase [Scytonema hofmannii]KYC35856.1 GCN5 family acetyltransferase [Scytonema hofmannii PCC 7110]
MKMIEIRSIQNEIEFNDMLYQRWLVLRAPLGLPRGTEKDLYEDNAFHAIALWNKQIIGSARLRLLSEDLGSIAYVAILPEFQNQGIGTKLMQKLIATAAEKNLKTLRVMARTNVLKFYNRVGFIAEGEPFDYLDIPHVFMYYKLQAYPQLVRD